MMTTNRLCESKSPATHKATVATTQPHRQWERKELDILGVKDHDDHEEEDISCILGWIKYDRLSDDPLDISWHHHD